LINPFVVVPLVVFAMLNIRQEKRADGALGIDVTGGALFVVCVGALLLSLDLLGSDGSSNLPIIFVALAVSAGTGVLFSHVELHSESPMVDLNLLRTRPFFLIAVINFFYGASNFGISTFIPLYTQVAFGLSIAEAGSLLVVRAIGVVMAGILSSLALPRTGYRLPIVSGLCVMSAALVAFSAGVDEIRELSGMSTMGVLLVLSAVIGVGHGIAGPATNNAALDIDPGQVASIMGLRGMFRFLGGAFGVAGIVIVTSHFALQKNGLELAFMGLAVITALSATLSFAIRETPKSHARRVLG
jgi:Na+/melibiose symporter-like transporter